MKNLKTIKKALISSVLSLLLCFSMLLGTTYAWFTDSVSSKNTIITSGNLDVELYHADKGTNGADEKVDDNTLLFDDVDTKKWEPGAMAWEKLTVENKGNLNLKYQLTLNAKNATVIESDYGVYSFTEVLKVALVDENFVYTRENVEALPAESWKDLSTFTLTGNLEGTPEGATESPSKTYGIIIWWQPSDIDNIFNTKDNVSVEVGVTLVATQQIGESDSTGDDYDEDAWVDGWQVFNASDLLAALNAGEDVKLMDDIDAGKIEITEDVKIDLNGKTLNATIMAPDAEVTIENGTIKGTDPSASAIEINSGSLTLNDVEVVSERHGVRIDGDVDVVINGGTYKVDPTTVKTLHALNVSGNANVIINGGTFIGAANTNADSGAAINVQNGATVIINGGNFSGGKNWTLFGNGTLIVKGGTFDQKPLQGINKVECVAEGYEATQNSDGTWTVQMKKETAKNLFETVEDGGTVTLGPGTFTIPSVGNKTITVEGQGENTVLDFTQANNVGGAAITFKNLHIQGKNENVMSGFGIQHTTGDIVYENCTFDGAVTNEYRGTVTYKNCTFTGTGYITTYAVSAATFENCVFDKADSRAVLVYSHGDNPCVVTLTDCTFKAAAKATTYSGDWTAAVEVDTTNIPTAGTSVTINNCTADEMYSGIVRDKSGAGKANAAITVDGIAYAFQAGQLASVLTSDAETINVVLGKDIDCPITSLGSQTAGSGEYKLGSENTKVINIDLNGKKLNITTTYWSAIGAKNADATITIKNGSMTSTGNSAGTWNAWNVRFSNCHYVIENVTFDKAVALDNVGKTTKMTDVTINENSGDKYALWITAEGQTVEIDGLTINSTGRGIKIDEQYVDSPTKVTLSISNSKFTTVKKAAILVKSAAGADITVKNVGISGVAADTTNVVWVDADAIAYADKVTVTGATVINEP